MRCKQKICSLRVKFLQFLILFEEKILNGNENFATFLQIAPQIKRKMMEDGSMMIGYNPLTTKGYVNFFRVIITNPMTTPLDMDFILDEMDRIGHGL